MRGVTHHGNALIPAWDGSSLHDNKYYYEIIMINASVHPVIFIVLLPMFSFFSTLL